MQTGEVIKFLRKKSNLTQDELAIKLQGNKSSIQKYESGAVSDLKMETIRELCQLFSVPPQVFIFPETIATSEILSFISDNNMRIPTALNKEGLRKVIIYIQDLYEIDRYKIRQDGSR